MKNFVLIALCFSLSLAFLPFTGHAEDRASDNEQPDKTSGKTIVLPLKKPVRIDLSSPQSTYDTCYSTIDFSTKATDVKQKTKTCLTRTAQQAVISYAVLGGYFISGLKDLKGKQKYPAFAEEIEAVFEKHNLKKAAREEFQKADLPAILTDIVSVYTANPSVTEQFSFSGRSLEDIDVGTQAAKGKEVFSLKHPFPANKLILSFVKIDGQWLVNHISHL